MMSRRLLLTLALCVQGTFPVHAADTLGRLFFTPEKRASLDRTRSLNLRQAQQVEGTSLSLEGVVKRSSGRNTVWINGRPHDLASPRDGVAVNIGSDPSSASIIVADEPPARLRVGETINRGTRETSDVIGQGRIAARRQAQDR